MKTILCRFTQNLKVSFHQLLKPIWHILINKTSNSHPTTNFANQDINVNVKRIA